MMADIKAKFQYNDTDVSIAFPCSESELRTKLAKLHAPEDTAELFLAKVEYPTELRALENTFVNLDEMNYLAKRLDSFFGNEELQFYEAMRLEGFTSLKDLINLSFNLDKYTLIHNVGDMQKVGIEYTLNTQGGMPADDTDNPKYAEIGRKLLQSGKSMPKGQFVVMKTGFYPMKVKLKLFFKWGISFDEKHPYEIPDQGNRKVEYAEKKDILDGIVKKYRPDLLEPPVPADDDGGMLGNQEQQMTEKNEPNPAKPQNRDRRRNGGAAVQTAPRNRRNPMPEVAQEQEAPSDAQA